VGAAAQVAEIAVGQHPFGLALSHDGRLLYAVNVLSNDLSVVNLQERKEVKRIAVGESPYCVLVDEGRERLYVTNQHADTISVVDSRAREVVATMKVGGYPEGVALVGDTLLVVQWMDDELSVWDLHSLKSLRRIAVGHNPRGFGQFISTQ